MLREKARLIVISLVIGLIAAGGFYMATAGKGRISGKSAAKQNEAVKTSFCVVAARDIDRRTRLDKSMLKVAQVPQNMMHPEAITNPDDAVGFFTEEKLYSGEMLIRPQLSKIKAPGELSFSVPQGKRAVTIAVTPVSGVGNMLRPGDRVDVLSHIGQQTAGEDVVFTLFEDTMVLAIDDRTDPEKDKPSSVPGVAAAAPQNNEYKTVTIAVSAEEGNKLAYAESVGDVRLVLHSAAGVDEAAYRKPLSQAAMASLYGYKAKPAQASGGAAQASAPAVKVAPPPLPSPAIALVRAAPPEAAPVRTAPAPNPDDTIYVYRGSEMTSVSVQTDVQVKKISPERGAGNENR